MLSCFSFVEAHGSRQVDLLAFAQHSYEVVGNDMVQIDADWLIVSVYASTLSQDFVYASRGVQVAPKATYLVSEEQFHSSLQAYLL